MQVSKLLSYGDSTMAGLKHEMVPWFTMDHYKQHETKLVAEIGNIHEGSLGNIIHMIESCAANGADAVKLQNHIPEESSYFEKFPERFHYHPQDKARQNYWRRLSIPYAWWVEIVKTCENNYIDLIVSSFSIKAFNDLHKNFGNKIWGYKVASGEVNNRPLLESMANTDKRIIVSTGMSDTLEVNSCLSYFLKGEDTDNEVYCLQCTTAYPTPMKDVGLNVVDVYNRNISFKGGLSDHSGLIYPGIIAAYMGAHMVEVHVCWDKRQFGADASSSLTFSELIQLKRGMVAAEVMRCNPVNKDLYTPSEDAKVYREGKTR